MLTTAMHALVAVAGAATAQAAVPENTAAGKPNKTDNRPDIVWIMTDQQTEDALSCLGNPNVKTPNMDALAADGVILRRAYCPYPLSGPCRSSLMTGLMPVQIGATDNGVRPDQAALDNGIGHRMSDAGYDCLFAGKWHAPEINVPDDAGFKRLCDMDDRQVPDACRKGLEKRDKSKPMFLVASFLDPHEICEFARDETLPYGELPPFETADCPQLPANFAHADIAPEALEFERNAFLKSHDTYTYGEEQWRRYLYGYYRLVERVDERIGEVITLLKEKGIYDNALIVFCSDHGDGVAAHGWNQKWALYEECINVPLIVKAPASAGGRRGVVNDTALSNIGLDLYSTFCDYAGVQLGDEYKGLSLRGVAEGKAEDLHDEVVVETFLSEIGTRGWTVVEGRYKYVLYQYFQGREGLFDLVTDEGEMHNLAYTPAFSAEVERLRGKLLDWAKQTGDAKARKQLAGLVAEKGMKTGHINGNR